VQSKQKNWKLTLHVSTRRGSPSYNSIGVVAPKNSPRIYYALSAQINSGLAQKKHTGDSKETFISKGLHKSRKKIEEKFKREAKKLSREYDFTTKNNWMGLQTPIRRG
jgi:hypothetical protein